MGYTILFNDINKENDGVLSIFYMIGFLVLIFEGIGFLNHHDEINYHK